MMKKMTFLIITGLAAQIACADVWDDLAKYEMGDNQNPPPVEIEKLVVETPADQMGPVEARLIAVVESQEATPEARWFACRMLQRVGTEKCVPVLAKLLCDERMSHYARLPLERMTESAAAGKALREALDRAPDKLKPGIAGTLGVRRDAEAVDALAKLAESANAQLALAALNALGGIGGQNALKALQGVKLCAAPDMAQSAKLDYGGNFFKQEGSEDVKAQVLTAVRAAHAGALLQAARNVKDAGVVEGVWNEAGCDTLKAAALSAMADTDAGKAAKLLSAALEGESACLFDAALTLLMEYKDSRLTQAAVGSLPGLADERKAALVNVLGWRGDSGALAAVRKAIESDNEVLRRAAIGATARLGDGGSVKDLLACAAKGDKDCVVSAVSRMTGAGVDDALIDALGDAGVSLAAAEVLAQRETPSAIPALVTLAGGGDEAAGKAAWDALGEIAGDRDLDALLKLTLGVGGRKIKGHEISAIKSICTRAKDKNACINALGAYYDSAESDVKKFILDTAAAAGGSEGMKYVRSALASGNDELRLQAVRAMSAWTEYQHVEKDLLELARNAPEEKVRILAVRGYIGHSGSERNHKKFLKMLESAQALVTRGEEKKMLVTAADGQRDEFVVPFLTGLINDADVAEDARRAVVGKARKCIDGKKHLEELRKALTVIANDGKSEKGLARKAKEELGRMGG